MKRIIIAVMGANEVSGQGEGMPWHVSVGLWEALLVQPGFQDVCQLPVVGK
jgi:hypothetical protein